MAREDALTSVYRPRSVGSETTAAGIHPSDHGGVVSVVKITGLTREGAEEPHAPLGVARVRPTNARSLT